MNGLERDREKECVLVFVYFYNACTYTIYVHLYIYIDYVYAYVYMYICIYKYQYCMHLPFNISLAQKAEVAAIPSPEARDVVFILDLGCSVFVSCCTVNDQKKTVDPLFSSGF